MMKTFNKLYLLACAITLIRSSDQNNDHLSVPKPVLDHILNFNKQYQYEPAEERTVPVYNVEIGGDDQINSQQIQMLGLRNIDEQLRTVFQSGEVTDHIVSQVEQRASKPSFRQQESCPPTTNIISVDVPPNELTIFHERMERVTQQNNNVLLRLVNEIVSKHLVELEKRLMAFTDQRIDMVHQQIETKFRDLRIVAKQSLYNDEVTKHVNNQVNNLVNNQVNPKDAVVDVTNKVEAVEQIVVAEDKDVASEVDETETESLETETVAAKPTSNLTSLMRGSIRIH